MRWLLSGFFVLGYGAGLANLILGFRTRPLGPASVLQWWLSFQALWILVPNGSFYGAWLGGGPPGETGWEGGLRWVVWAGLVLGPALTALGLGWGRRFKNFPDLETVHWQRFLGLSLALSLGLAAMDLGNLAHLGEIPALVLWNGVYWAVNLGVLGWRYLEPARPSAPPVQAVSASATGRLTALGLSAREQEIVALLNQGFLGKEIAFQLQLSPATVKNHIAHIYQKTKVRGRVGLLNLVREP